MNEEDYKKRFDELADPDILEKIVDCYSSKIVGEENNIKLLWCACLSKDLPKEVRSSIIITSQSSAGKSTLVNTLLQPFQEDVLDYTNITQAFFQRTTDSLDGKIFKIEQLEKTNEKKQVTMGNLKFSISEGRFSVGLVDKNEKGKNEPKKLEVLGRPVFITTSTNYNIDPETLNRTFLMQVDESEVQTKKITSYLLKKYGSLNINDNWETSLEQLKRYSKSYKEFAHQIRDIAIPFWESLDQIIPTSNLTIRRDLPKILNLACILAFIHFPNRVKIANNEGEHFIQDSFGNSELKYTYTLIVEPCDFKEALKIGSQTIKQTLNKLNQSSMDIYDKIKQLCLENEGEVSIKEIANVTGYSINRARELTNPLVASGHVTREKSTTREYLYSPTEKKFENITTKDIIYTDEDLKEWIKNELGDNSAKFTVLYPRTEILNS